ncbi:MAG: YigZ family protein [Clostridiales bacterium]|jgi:putative IMPACT (imprinted ancient) family translation regulator|nr:YigZ family protein [Clostridiales bacterium]
MTDSYLAAGSGRAEIVVKRSRFIGIIEPVTDERDALIKLADLRKKYYDASHLCHAYIADERGVTAKSADDGEPPGTAGIPILTVLKASGCKKLLGAVARYFGGVKLGTGGLTRAYSDCVRAALAAAPKITLTRCGLYSLAVPYGFPESAFAPAGIAVIGRSFGEEVTLTLAVKSGVDMAKSVANITKGAGTPQFIKTDYINYAEYKEIQK